MDGFEGLALAIFGAMACMLVVPALIGAALGYLALRRRSPWLGVALGVVVGGLIGAVAVGFTFFEDTMRPPPQLSVDVPPGFQHEWVFFLADPTSRHAIEWEGRWTPSARVAVPRSGVLRVRDLGRLDGDLVEVSLSDGRTDGARAAVNVPVGLGGGRMVAFGFASWPGTEPDVGLLDDDALVARIRALEAEDQVD
jgi:hypothetical protein